MKNRIRGGGRGGEGGGESRTTEADATATPVTHLSPRMRTPLGVHRWLGTVRNGSQNSHWQPVHLRSSSSRLTTCPRPQSVPWNRYPSLEDFLGPPSSTPRFKDEGGERRRWVFEDDIFFFFFFFFLFWEGLLSLSNFISWLARSFVYQRRDAETGFLGFFYFRFWNIWRRINGCLFWEKFVYEFAKFSTLGYLFPFISSFSSCWSPSVKRLRVGCMFRGIKRVTRNTNPWGRGKRSHTKCRIM